MATDFTLDPRLAGNSRAIGDLPLAHLRLVDNLAFPWVLLIPRRTAIREIHELTPTDQSQLIAEASHVAAGMQAAFKADKMNVAALGNAVPQLHVHVIARWAGDICWPGPIWAGHEERPLSACQWAARESHIRAIFDAWR